MVDVRAEFETKIPARIASNPAGAKSVGAIYLFKITGDGGGTWTLNLKDNPGVTEGDQGNAECTLEMSAESFAQIQKSPGSAMQLFFQGKLKVGGNAMLATKLQQVLG